MKIGKRTLQSLNWKRRIDVDKWAEENFILESSSAVGGGNFSFKYSPIARLPLQAFNYRNISNISYWIASQGGKSTISYVLLNYCIDRLNGNIAFYLPNDQLVGYTASDRIIPSIKRIPANRKLMQETKDIDKKKDNSKIIRFGDMVLRVLGAESSSNRKSFPAKYIFMDEIAEFEESHVLEIEERNKTFSSFNGKIVKLSTSLHNNDPIVLSHKRAECQMEYYVKCPKCGKSHIDNFIENVVFPKDIEIPDGFETEEDKKVYLNGYKARNAMYKCPKCNELWDSDMKQKAVEMGEWKPLRGTLEKSNSVSFRASSFVSYFVSIYDLAKRWLDVEYATDEIKIKFYNGWLSQVYEPKIEQMPQDDIWTLKGKLKHEELPNDTIGLVGAIDVQKDHYYGIVVAVDSKMNRHITEYTRLETEFDLENFIYRPRYTQDGNLINVEVFGKDSGYRSNEVYNFCDMMNHLHEDAYHDEDVARIFEARGGEAIEVIPIKGSSNSTSNGMAGRSNIKSLDTDLYGKMFKDTVKLHTINTYLYADTSMNMIIDTIKKINEGIEVKNGLFIHADMDDLICKALVSEFKKEVKEGVYQFTPVQSHPFNHYWDCLKYCNYLIDKLEIRHRLSVAREQKPQEQVQQRQRRSRGNYRDNY